MSALPRPEVAGPVRALNDALHDLHHRAGWPSLRTLARETGVSHTTVSKAFSTPALPSWGTIEVLVRALDGDTATFHHLWLAASSLPNDPGPGQTAAPRIAGRRDELATVRHHLETSTGLLLITGEAGIGKSALMATACQEAESWILTGHCLPLSTQIPLLPVVEALRNLHEEDDGEVLRGVLRACPAYVKNSLTRLLPALADSGHLDGPDHQWSHQQLFAAIRTVLEVLQRQRSTALVIEDLHWADTDTLDLLEQVTHTSPVTVVGTWRLHDPEVPARHRDWLARAQRRATSIELQPLSLDDSILQLRLLRSDITDDQARLIHERSQGQPLFTEQLLDAPGPSSSSPLLDDLLDRRIAPVRRRAWLVASVLGVADRPLVDGTLRGATGLGRVQLAKSLQELREQRLLDVAGDAYHLPHPLLAEAVRRRLLPGETADVHQRLARAMSAHPGAEPAEVALHWQHANEPTEELIWRIRAARAASQRYAASQAADHWLRALDLWPAGSPTAGVPPIRRYHAIAGAVSQLEAAGRPTEEAAVLEPALEAPEEFEVMERADLLHLSARANSTQPLTTPGTGLQLIDQSIELFRTLPPSGGLALALRWKSIELEWHGRRDEAVAAITEAARVAAAVADVALERSVRAHRAWQLAVAGDEGAVREVEALHTAFPGGTDLVPDLSLAVRHTDILLMACRPATDVEEVARRELRRAEQSALDAYHYVDVLKSNVSQAWRRAGHLKRALRVVAASTEADEPGERAPILHTERALLELLLGNTDRARRRLTFLNVGQHKVVDPFIVNARMQYDLWAGDPADALCRFETLVESRHDEISPGIVGDLLALGARAAADSTAQSSPSARRDAHRLMLALRARLHHDPYEPPVVLSDRAAEPQWSAEIARIHGKDTADTWLAAVRRWDSLGRPHDSAYCRWRAAQCALRDSQGTAAARLLRRAGADAREHVPLSQAIAWTAAGRTRTADLLPRGGIADSVGRPA
jgi:type II secretory pathway predicted ATPase ExeA